VTAVTRIVLIRHGQTAWNVQGRIQGHTDIELNALGRAQAARLAQALHDEGLNAVVSSDLQRALSTAQALADPLGLAVHADSGLRERGFGAMEGLSFTQIDERHPEWALPWRRREPGFEPPGGESLLQFQARCLAAAHRLAQQHAGQCVAWVSHGGVLDVLYRAAVGAELQAPRSWQLDNASVNRLLYTGTGFNLVGWNDQQHLHDLSADES
jgi:2,3-bisphosphoglycerate-dependent phosphoglycerate mutase